VRGLHASSPELRRSLLQFFASDWFRRVWTVQEFVLGKQVAFQHGRSTIAGQRVQDAFGNLRKHAADSCCGLDESITIVDPAYDTNLFFALTKLEDIDDMRRYREVKDFLEMLSMNRNRQCSNPHDRIYGILGMSFKGPRPQFQADYPMRVETLFIKVIREHTKNSKSLDFLSHIISGAQPNLELPSFIPDWTVSLSPPTFLRYKSRLAAMLYYSATAELEATFEIATDQQARVAGLIVDRIKATGTPTLFTDIEDVGRTKAVVDEARCIAGLPTLPPASLELATREELDLWLCLCGNLSVDLEGTLRIWRMADPALDYDSYLRWSDLAVARIRDGREEESADFGAFGSTLLANCTARRFIRGEKGLLGFAPADCRPGDLMVLLAGGKVPYVLREVPRSATEGANETYRFIGDAYIQSLMHGERIQQDTEWEIVHLV